MQKHAFGCSAQMGGMDADAALLAHFRAFKAAFADSGALPCDQLELIAFVLRVGGSVRDFPFEGCEKIDLNRKKKYISIDVGVPIARWQGRSDKEIAVYLIDAMREGLDQMLAHLSANKITCDAAAIRSLFEAGAQGYLAAWSALSSQAQAPARVQ